MTAQFAADVLQAYQRWAPIYPPVPHNPVMRVEQQAMQELWPSTAGCRALDLACGSGRYSRLLKESGAAHVVALDFCVPMLAQVSSASRVCASMMQLPFANESFDVVVSGLAVGHASSLEQWMGEAARVLAPGGVLLYSDFHPEAAQAGITRSFRDGGDVVRTVPHTLYGVEVQKEAAAAAGLRVTAVRELRVGHELREPFPKSEAFYSRWRGLPMVLIVSAVK